MIHVYIVIVLQQYTTIIVHCYCIIVKLQRFINIDKTYSIGTI